MTSAITETLTSGKSLQKENEKKIKKLNATTKLRIFKT